MNEQDKKIADSMRIFEALSGVDEELLIRCEDSGAKASAKVRPIWYYSRVVAACLCFVVMGALLWSVRPMMKSEDKADGMAAEAPAAMAVEAPAPMAMQEAEAVQDAAPAEAYIESAAEYGYTQKSASTATGEAEASNELEKDAAPTVEICGVPSLEEQKLTLADASAVALLGDYVPTVLPAGYQLESAGLTEAASARDEERLNLCWVNGMDTIHISIWVPRDYATLAMADIAQSEAYNVHLYEIPYAETVPEEYRQVFNAPVFTETDFGLEVVEARMKAVADAGDTDTPRGDFAVLYDSGVVVKFNGDGDARSIYEMFESMKR